MSVDFDLRKHTHLLAVAGSRAVNTFTPSSDVDIMGVVVPPREYFFGAFADTDKRNTFNQCDNPDDLQVFSQDLSSELQSVARNTKLEGTVYSLSKYIHLAAQANPTIFNLIFCRDEEVILCDKIGERLRENRELFLSQKIKETFLGFAAQQRNRITLHKRGVDSPPKKKPERSDFGLFDKLSQKEESNINVALSKIQSTMDSWELDMSSLDKDQRIKLQLRIKRHLEEIQITSNDKWEAASRKLGFSEENIALLKKESDYKKALSDWKSYEHWLKHRNPERAKLEAEFGFDLKHGAHLYRIVLMGEEALKTGVLSVWREDRENIMNVLRGGWSYEQLIEWFENKYKEIRKMKSPLPKLPDYKKLNNLCVELTETALGISQGE